MFNEKQGAVNEGLKTVGKEDGGLNVGVNVGVNSVYEQIKNSPGINAKKLKLSFDETERTIERWLKQLRDDGKIVFKGAPKTGGYYINE